MVESRKELEVEYVMQLIGMQKVIINMKDYDKNKEWYLNYWDVNNLYGWAISQKLQVIILNE